MAPRILRSQRLASRSKAAASPAWKAETSSSSVGAKAIITLRRAYGYGGLSLAIYRYQSSAWVCFIVYCQNMARIQICIPLGRGQAGMTQKLLNRTEIRTTLQEMGR